MSIVIKYISIRISTLSRERLLMVQQQLARKKTVSKKPAKYPQSIPQTTMSEALHFQRMKNLKNCSNWTTSPIPITSTTALKRSPLKSTDKNRDNYPLSKQSGRLTNPTPMIETILQIENYIYPFEQRSTGGRSVKVEDIQTFATSKELLEKKNEMQIKGKLIDSPSLIKLQKIYQEDLTLHFIYEYVPYSLYKYIQKHYKTDKVEIVDMSAKLFLKKISYELTLLISYLAHMKIEVDLCVDNLGLTEDEKLKLYMNARCKMGHKTELSLIAYYGHCKEKILSYIESEFNLIKQKEESPPNFVIKGNKLVFPPTPLNESIYDNHSNSNYQAETEYDSSFNTTNESNLYSSNYFANNNQNKFTASCINPNPIRTSNLRQTQSPHFSRSFNFSEAKGSTRSANKAPKNHKNSFQFGAKRPPRADKSYTDYDDDNSDAKSFTHSRSIRIELEQKVDPTQRKKRKDSYKVKITTFHQYEMDDCNPQDLFGKNPQREEDIFEHFAKQARTQQKRNRRDEEQYEQEETPSNVNMGPFQRKQSMPEYGHTATTSGSTRNLQQKVRQAKQKAETILNRYLKSKKKAFSFNQ